jgi:hypothetical protein
LLLRKPDLKKRAKEDQVASKEATVAIAAATAEVIANQDMMIN